MTFNKLFAQLAQGVARAAGTPLAFAICLLVVVAWAASGPLFHFSDTWQLVINTGTTIITFLMVFLIQNTQNRDGAAVQIKLDELILSSKAENEFIGIERLTDKELEALHERCVKAAERTHSMAERTTAELDARRARRPPNGSDANSAKPKAASPARKRAPAKPKGKTQG